MHSQIMETDILGKVFMALAICIQFSCHDWFKKDKEYVLVTDG